MSSASYSPMAHWKFWSQGGTPAPAAGYLLWFYQAGTTTPQAAYTDTTGGTPAANPIVLDTNGECNFCLSDTLAYKLALYDPTGLILQTGWPVDNVQSGTLSAMTAILALLANSATVTNGAGAINFNASLSYPAGTVGNQLKGTTSSAQVQNQALVFFTSAWDSGGIPAYKLTPSPVLLSYTIGQRFHIKVHANGVTGYNTLNINTLGAWPVYQFDQFGNQVAAPLVAGTYLDVEYIGSAFLVLNPTPPNGNEIRGAYKNLHIGYSGASLSFTVAADEVLVKNSNGDTQIVTTISDSPSLAGTGLHGLDTGSPATNTAYYVYVIWAPITSPTNGTPQSGCLISASATTPTLPPYFTHFARVGAFITDKSAGYPYCGNQFGRKFRFIPAGNLAGTAGNPSGYLTLSPGVVGTVTGNPVTFTTQTASGTTPAAFPATLASFDAIFNTSAGTVMVAAPAGSTIWGYLSAPILSDSVTACIPFTFPVAYLGSAPSFQLAANGAGYSIIFTGWEDSL